MPSLDASDVDTAGKEALDQWDRVHSWHPFTQMQEYEALPQLHVDRGEGCWLWDTEGRRYLDGNASVWTNAHGHNDSEINQVLIDQIGKVAHSTYLGLSHPVGARLGAKLAEISPSGLERVIFSDNGSCAVEIALKLSFQYWQLVGKAGKRIVVGMDGGYHGDTFGAMSAGNSESFHGRFAPWCFESLSFPAPYSEADGEASVQALEELLAEKGEEIACLVMEPSIQGPAGMRLQPLGFVKRVEQICRRYDVHLILDEVFVGFGRMGSLLVSLAEEVSPDFLCLAKGLSAGYLPLAATLTSETIYKAFLGSFESGTGFFHGHTFTGNPLAATVSLKSIEKVERLVASGRLKRTIEYFGRRMVEIFEFHPNLKAMRQRGLAAALDLYPGEGREPWTVNQRMGMQVCLKARSFGLLLRPLMDSILVVPPLVISEDEIDFLFENLRASIDATLTSNTQPI